MYGDIERQRYVDVGRAVCFRTVYDICDSCGMMCDHQWFAVYRSQVGQKMFCVREDGFAI